MRILLFIIFTCNLYALEVSGSGNTKAQAMEDMIFNYHLRSGSKVISLNQWGDKSKDYHLTLVSSFIIKDVQNLKCIKRAIWNCNAIIMTYKSRVDFDYRLDSYEVVNENLMCNRNYCALLFDIKVDYPGLESKFISMQVIDYSEVQIREKMPFLIERRLLQYEATKEHQTLMKVSNNKIKLRW